MAVQAALIWFVDNFLKLAEWLASVVRVDHFQEGLEKLDLAATVAGDVRITLRSSADDAIRIDRLAVAHSNGTLVIGESSVIIERGERVLIVGESGTGKSTLIRALAGIWPWGSGSIALPDDQVIAFVPQKPYIPLGSLRTVLLYPQAELQIADDVIVAALERCGLGALADRLGEVQLWDRILSGGERQKIAFARLLILRPDIVIMDEATSAWTN
jgi:putative ATP-binding cassette transporter